MKLIRNLFSKIFLLIIIFQIIGCSSHIMKFNPTELNSNAIFTPYFDKNIKPLKNEWKDLYYYLKRGHILQNADNNDFSYIYSYKLYKYLKSNLLKIYETPYLQEYDNFIKVFGQPRKEWERDGKINISYFQSVIGDSCTTCSHHGFGYVFDSATKKLLKE